MAYKEYEDESELRKLQELSTQLLLEVDRVCTELGIPYFAYAGTALGALRHEGFIPWDDDVDVVLRRDDYERFLTEAPALLDDRFEIVNTRTEPNFTSPYSYLALKNTFCIPEFFRTCPYRKPITIDIFPLDKVSDDPSIRKKQLRSTWLWGRLIFLRATPEPYLPFDGPKRALVLAACHLAHGFLKATRLTPEKLQARWEAAARMAEGEASDRMADFSDQDPLAWSVAEDELFPVRHVPFEGASIAVPHRCEELLARSYGDDYMTPPPPEKRKNHYPFLLDFGPYA